MAASRAQLAHDLGNDSGDDPLHWGADSASFNDGVPIHLLLDFDDHDDDDDSADGHANSRPSIRTGAGGGGGPGSLVSARFSLTNGDTEVVVVDHLGDHHCVSPCASHGSARISPVVAYMPSAAKKLAASHDDHDGDSFDHSTTTLASVSVSPRNHHHHHQHDDHHDETTAPPSTAALKRLWSQPFPSSNDLVVSGDLVGERLGAGASGSVHALRSVDAAVPINDVAVKVIEENTAAAAAAAAREIAFAARLKDVHARGAHPRDRRVVSVHRVYRSVAQQRTMVTMELLSGATALDIAALQPAMLPASVRARLPGGTADDADAESDGGGLRARVREGALAAVARDTLEGLVFLHGTARVAHRDLRPENLLLDRDGRVKIGDFGMAAVAPSQSTAAEDKDEAACGMDAFAEDQVGTIGYLSPERLRGEAHGAPGDMWALGVTLLQLALGGRHPLRFDPASGEASGTLGFFQVASRLGALDQAGAADAAPPPAVQRALDACLLSPVATAFIGALLRPAAAARPTAAQAREHPWLK